MPLNQSDVNKSLINRFIANPPKINGVDFSMSKVKFPNAPFKTPKNETWIRLTIVKGRGVSIQSGAFGISRTEGFFIADIFTVKGTGDLSANLIADQINNLYKKKNFDNIRCTEIEINSIGETESWYQTQVSVSFNFDTCQEN